jgi:hypothetical protein
MIKGKVGNWWHKPHSSGLLSADIRAVLVFSSGGTFWILPMKTINSTG